MSNLLKQIKDAYPDRAKQIQFAKYGEAHSTFLFELWEKYWEAKNSSPAESAAFFRNTFPENHKLKKLSDDCLAHYLIRQLGDRFMDAMRECATKFRGEILAFHHWVGMAAARKKAGDSPYEEPLRVRLLELARDLESSKSTMQMRWLAQDLLEHGLNQGADLRSLRRICYELKFPLRRIKRRKKRRNTSKGVAG